jgi:hypothetical protein
MLARTSSRSLCRSSSVSPTIVITGTITAMSDTDCPDFAAPSATFGTTCCASRMSPETRALDHAELLWDRAFVARQHMRLL